MLNFSLPVELEASLAPAEVGALAKTDHTITGPYFDKGAIGYKHLVHLKKILGL